jgi:ABC-type multidrug transport system ATPase subunit
MLRCTDVRKSYGLSAVLDGVSLELTEGQICVLMGHSGCGKTTLLRCLALLESGDSGVVDVGSVAIRFPMDEPTLRRFGDQVYPKIGLVFQQLFLWPNMTCRQNLSLVSDDHNTIMQYSERLGVAGVLDRHPQSCSLGQKQRLAFIRAVLSRPQFLLCDEITSALDFESAGIVLGLLRELAENGTGILLITHDHDLVPLLGACLLIRMEHGRIVSTAKTTPTSEVRRLATGAAT